MSHITNPFQLLIKERRAKRKVIWAILLTNMGHITNQYGPYYQPIWAILLSHKTYKTYKSHTPYKPDKQFLPPWGIERGERQQVCFSPVCILQCVLMQSRHRR